MSKEIIKDYEEINPCGTYCGKCEDYGTVCDGCRNRDGKPIWYELYDIKETCGFYACSLSKGIHNCSECNQLPCDKYFEYPDPSMSDETKQMWFKLRMDNFNEIRLLPKIDILVDFQQNVLNYKNKSV